MLLIDEDRAMQSERERERESEKEKGRERKKGEREREGGGGRKINIDERGLQVVQTVYITKDRNTGKC